MSLACEAQAAAPSQPLLPHLSAKGRAHGFRSAAGLRAKQTRAADRLGGSSSKPIRKVLLKRDQDCSRAKLRNAVVARLEELPVGDIAEFVEFLEHGRAVVRELST